MEFVIKKNNKEITLVDKNTFIDLLDDIDNEISNSAVVIIDNLTTNTSDQALSAKQGKELKTLVDGKASSSDIPIVVDDLTTNDATKALSAKQGTVLADLIGDAIDYING